MPELPEVETVRRSLLKRLVGRRIESVDVHERRLRYPVDTRRLRQQCLGKRVLELHRRAKYLLVHLEGGGVLILHLGMSGSLMLVPASEPRVSHVHVSFRLDDGKELRFRDHRRFGLVDAVASSRLDADARFCHLGVEPLSDDCTAVRFHERSRGMKRPVKNFLMDAREVVGVGNIYASEALHVAGVNPVRAAGRLSLERWEKLTFAVQQVLRDAIRQGGTTLSDFRDADGTEGYFQVYLRVYGKEGEPCPGCGQAIRKRVMAGRSTFYCTRCQR